MPRKAPQKPARGVKASPATPVAAPSLPAAPRSVLIVQNPDATWSVHRTGLEWGDVLSLLRAQADAVLLEIVKESVAENKLR